jgi:hypothetical protein
METNSRSIQILNTEALNGNFQGMGTTIGEVILSANGFAEVYPEHKFQSECPSATALLCPQSRHRCATARDMSSPVRSRFSS